MFALGIASNNRIIIHNIPLILIGLNFGPLAGALSGLICDLSSAMYQPGWNPIFIFSTVLWGLIPGLLRDFNIKSNLKGLISIELITHIIVSVANTIAMGLLMGWSIALGSVKLDKSYDFIITLFDKEYTIFHIGNFIYLRIIFVILIMLIKMPIDIFFIHTIQKRKIIPSNYFVFEGLKNVKKI
jgi:LytS/YehU family sensor histidine kinase